MLPRMLGFAIFFASWARPMKLGSRPAQQFAEKPRACRNCSLTGSMRRCARMNFAAGSEAGVTVAAVEPAAFLARV